MDTEIATGEHTYHRGGSALFAENNQFQRFQSPTRTTTWPAANAFVKLPARTRKPKTVEKALDVDRQNGDGNTALHYAAFNGKLGHVRLLLATGANPNLGNRRGDSPLICAAYNGYCDVIMALVAAGADLNAKDEDGRTALTWAVIRDQADVVRLLISLGADINTYDNVDNSPLLWSVILNRREICDILVEAEERLGVR